MGFVITNILFAIIIAYLFYDVVHTIKEANDKFKTVFALITIIIAIAIFISFAIAAKETISIQAINAYLKGEIEVIEQIDTVRTFKFN